MNKRLDESQFEFNQAIIETLYELNSDLIDLSMKNHI